MTKTLPQKLFFWGPGNFYSSDTTKCRLVKKFHTKALIILLRFPGVPDTVVEPFLTTCNGKRWLRANAGLIPKRKRILGCPRKLVNG